MFRFIAYECGVTQIASYLPHFVLSFISRLFEARSDSEWEVHFQHHGVIHENMIGYLHNMALLGRADPNHRVPLLPGITQHLPWCPRLGADKFERSM